MDCLRVSSILLGVVSDSNPALYCRPSREKLAPVTITRYRKGLFLACILGATLVSPPDLDGYELTIAGGIYAYAEVNPRGLFVYTAFTRATMVRKIQ